MKSLTIAIDYDETFTADPLLFSEFIQMAKSNGHRCYLVTARRPTHENYEQIDAALDHWKCQMPVVFSSLGSKIEKMKSMGLSVDIWIDDEPEKLVRGH